MHRVLFVDHVSRILGGAEINLLELLQTAAPARRWVIACACPSGSPLDAGLKSALVPQFEYRLGLALNEWRLVGRRFSWLSAWRGLRALRDAEKRLVAIISEFRPDAVVSCTNKDHLAATAACHGTGVPSLWWVNDIVSPDFFSWPARRVFRRAARRASRLITVSDFARDALLREGIPPALAVRVHNGIPVERYRNGMPGKLRASLGLSADEPFIALIGRFTPWKGPEFFIDLARDWIAANPRGHFLLIGQAFNEEQEFEAGLRRKVAVSNLSGRVHFVPFQTGMADALRDLAVVIHASLRPEPFGRVIIEAMAAGVPVIAARAGGVPEIITHGVNGWLAAPGSIPEYRAALVTALAPGAARDNVIEAARQTVAERFSVRRVLADFEQIVTEVQPK